MPRKLADDEEEIIFSLQELKSLSNALPGSTTDEVLEGVIRRIRRRVERDEEMDQMRKKLAEMQAELDRRWMGRKQR